MDLKELKAKVSKKNATIARRKKDSSALQKHDKAKGVKASIKRAAKYLGLASTGGGRRSMATIKERVGKARKRANKVSWLNKKNEKAWALYTTGVYPQAVYGIEGVGYLFTMGSAHAANHDS